jgi:histidine triad (HIT) family protein
VNADCLFCKIAAKQIPSKIVYEDPDIFAFEDISPQAPTHVLICPRKHMASLDHAFAEDEGILGRLQTVATKIARERQLGGGYRTVMNTGPDAGQSVAHVHLHLLGGRTMRWPPG